MRLISPISVNAPTSLGPVPAVAVGAPHPAPHRAALLADRVLQIASSQVGVAEYPGRPNRGAQVDAYRGSSTGTLGWWPQAWCASYVSWVFNQAGAPLVDHNGDTWSSRIGDWARSEGRLRPPTSTPAPGDLVLFRTGYGAERWANHVGIVEQVHPDGSLTTIEGNIRDAVCRLERTRDRVVGFVATAGLDQRRGA